MSEADIDLVILRNCCGLVFRYSAYDFILGNIESVIKADDSDTWLIMFKEQTTTVQTRYKSKKQNPSCRQMLVPSALADVSSKEFVKEQQKDKTFDKFKTLAKIQKSK